MTAKAKIFPSMDHMTEVLGNKAHDEAEVAKYIKDVVEKVNDKMPSYKRISIVEVVWEPFEKTTTKKIKRFGTNVE